MSLYVEMQTLASGLFAEFKQGIIRYVRITPGTGPGDDPGPATETPFDWDATARGVKFQYVQNGLAIAGDLQASGPAHPALITDFANETVTRGFVTIDGQRYKIVKAIPKPAAGVPVSFTLIVRKG
jgi:hypothetical protein